MATVPTSGTNIRLLSNIPFSNDYKNTRWFDTLSAQTTYFTNKTIVHSMTEANFQRIEGKLFISVNKSIDELHQTNYLMFQNAHYNSKWFYGFVTKLEYVQRNVTYVHFQLDVFQTWKFDMDFKPSFVIREHCKLWNADGTPVINTVDEGLNYGTDYDIVSVENYIPYDDIFFLVIVTKSRLHNSNDGALANSINASINALPQPLCYYVHPFRLNGTSPDAIINVAPPWGLSDILTVLTNIYKQDNAVNNVVSLYVTDHIGVNPAYDSVNDTLSFSGSRFEGAFISDNVSDNIQTLYVKNMPDYLSKTKTFVDKYSGFKSVDESKLLMYPYTVTSIDDFKGNKVDLKNEYIVGNDIVMKVRGSIGTSNKVAYSIPSYLTGELGLEADRLIVSLENSLINNNANDVPIISDYLSAYLQGNRNSIENQKNSIMWNGVMGGIGSTIGGVASGLSKNPVGVASSGVDIVSGAGNTVLQLQAIEAKKQDISNTPPQMVKMGNNTQFDYGNGYKGIYVIKKQIKSEYRKKLSDFFKMFGYKMNEVKVPNFHTRQNWNYVQTSSCFITGNFNNEDLQELKSIFDNGITFWHTDDVGNYSLANGVI